jgi:DNA-binding transcriptional ArsR family regulator
MPMTEERLDAAFTALSDPTRRAIVSRLARGDATVSELAAPFDMSLPGVSKHLKVLERSGLISRRRDAQFRPCHLEADTLDGALDWIETHRRLWEERFDKLDTHLRRVIEGDGSAGTGRATATTRRSGDATASTARKKQPGRGARQDHE